ncbi:MAG: hypothetical protein LQ346_007903 [Caloplaca aetnensis]|nr:MAG: hypothetical protein LQ346_007903 [Caloplaca aetnensis]
MPKHAASAEPPLVPYVCRGEYDGGPFLTYLTRRTDLDASVPRVVTDPSDLAWFVQMPLEELEDLIQTWLFFGLLTEVFGDLFIPSHYVRTTGPTQPPELTNPVSIGTEKFLNTSRLLPMVNSWTNRIQSTLGPGVNLQNGYKHIAACLHLTLTTLRGVTFSMTAGLVDPWILTAIASVGELLENASNHAYAIRNPVTANLCPSGWKIHYMEAQSLFHTQNDDLCPHEVHRIRYQAMSLQTQHYLTCLKREMPSSRHQHCTERQCRANLKDLGQYVVRHQQEDCQCTHLFVNVEEIISILSKGSLPLLRILPAPLLSDIRVEVVEATPEVHYLALSHVWADGLGNPHSNSLPRCQLQALFKLSRLFVETQEVEALDQEMLIWIDTLCCPVKPMEAKAMALSRMKEPNTDATYVVVLSASLQNINAQVLDPMEICLRILTSEWMRRLWTLQEGALPGSLWFHFNDAVVDLRQMWLKVVDIFKNDIGQRGLALDVMALQKNLRRFFHPEKGEQPLDLEAINQAVQYRSVTVASDEPLLIAGLLSLDIAHVLDGSEESRMQRLWALMPSIHGGIPKNVLFCRGARLHQKGFRWAPASLLSLSEVRNERLRNSEIDEDASPLTPAGLCVRLPAFSIKMASVPNGFPRDLWDTWGQKDDNIMYCRSNQGLWFVVWADYDGFGEADGDINRSSLHQLLETSTSPLTLLTARELSFDVRAEVTDGLLVHKDFDEDNISRVTSDMVVNVAVEAETTVALLEAAYQASRTLLNDDITTQLATLGLEHESDPQSWHPAYASLEAQLTQKIFTLSQDIRDPRIVDAVRAHSNRDENFSLPSMIATAYLGCYCELGPMLPSTTEWCVD